MTLAEIRERYGVPAEVGMRVRFTPPPTRMVCHGRIIGLCAYTEGYLLAIDGLSEGIWSFNPERATYYNDDGEVIWRPETAKS